MSNFFEIDDCGGEPVRLEIADSNLLFHGFDLEAELAAVELGFERSPALLVWENLGKEGLNQGLVNACVVGSTEAARAFIWIGADITSGEHAALRLAACGGHLETTVLLLELGSDPLAFFDSGLDAMIFSGRADVVELLLPLGSFDEKLSHWIEVATEKWKQPAIARLLKGRQQEAIARLLNGRYRETVA